MKRKTKVLLTVLFAVLLTAGVVRANTISPTTSTSTIGNLFDVVNHVIGHLEDSTSTLATLSDLATTTGNIIVATSSQGWFALPVGTNGQVLTASSSDANRIGVAWDTATANITINSETAGTWTFATSTVFAGNLRVQITTSSDTLTFQPSWGFTPTNGQLLIGNGADFSLGTLTAGSGVNIANASGSITVVHALRFTGTVGQVIVASSSAVWTFSLPQSINTTSSVQFATIQGLSGVTSTNVSATGTLSIPNGTACEADTDGEICHDTTADQLILGADGDVFSSLRAVTAPFTSSSLVANYDLGRLPYGITITRVDCLMDPADTGDSIVIDIDERDANGDSPSTVLTGDLQCLTTNQFTTTFANAVLDSGDYWSIDLSGSASTTLDRGSVTIQYTISRE